MLENSWYSVISPEGCAAILWRDNAKANLAAEALRITAPDLEELGVIDAIIREPVGGAHRDFDSTAQAVKEQIIIHLNQLENISGDNLIQNRIDKYGKMGYFKEIKK
jgi:acetyl-CoA carboxylase carboxyl transferase subunit alpha